MVSVALATYNGERFLGDQLRSLATQTLLPSELVVGDDRSTDRTAAIVERFARDAPFAVRFVRREPRLGYVANFVMTAALCQSTYVAFCDQDDVWLPQKLERCVGALAAPGGPSLVAHTVEAVDEDLRPLGFREPALAADVRYPAGHGLPSQPWRGFTLCFERQLLDLVPFSFAPPPADPAVLMWGHEDWLWLLAGLRSGTQLLAEPLALYRQHGRNLFGAMMTDQAVNLKLAAANTPDSFRGRARAADYWADVIRRARDAGELSSLAVGADAVEHVHRSISRSLQIRAHMYEPSARLDKRWRDLAALIAAKSYRPLWRGGLGARAIVKDLAVCLLGAHTAGRVLPVAIDAVLSARRKLAALVHASRHGPAGHHP